MSRKDKLIKSKSIYSIRRKHQTLSTGTIYENDHVTILQNDGIFDEDIPMFSDSNFKFRIRRGTDAKKRHARYGWLTNLTSESQVWTLATMPEGQPITEETEIVQKPNYSSLADFAYYGSAVELIRATVNDVIMRYPGGISYYRQNEAPSVWVDGQRYYLISNEFNIDFWTPKGVSSDGLENPMRVLGASYMNYEDKDGNDINLTICITGNCLDSIIGKVSFSNYYGSGEENATRSVGENLVFGSSTEGVNDDDDENSTPASGHVLTVTVYNLYPNGQTAPLLNTLVTFRAYVSKNCAIYEKTVSTDNQYGIAKVIVGERQGWTLISGDDSITATDYWSVRLGDSVADFTNVGKFANLTILCEENCKVSSIRSRNDVIEINKKCKQLNVTAVTYNIDTEEKFPIIGQKVNFYAYVTKGNAIYYNSANTDSHGIAHIKLCETYGWEIINDGNDVGIEEATHWVPTMTYEDENQSGTTMYGINFLGQSANTIYPDEDYNDEIVFKREETPEPPEPPTPEPICLVATAYTQYPNNNTYAIANKWLYFRAYTKNCAVYEIMKKTDEDGIATACLDDPNWEKLVGIDESVESAEYWSVRLYNDVFDPHGNNADLRIACESEQPVSLVEDNHDFIVVMKECKKLMVSAYTVNADTDERYPISGEVVNYYAYSPKGQGIYYNSGFTDEDGVIGIELCEGYGWILTSGNDSGIENSTHWVPTMTYNGQGESGTTMYGINFLGQSANTIYPDEDYEDIIEFKVTNPEPPTPPTPPEPICLIATAYTQYPNGNRYPIKDKSLFFTVYNTKSCTKYTKSKTTDDEGVASVCLDDDGWTLLPGGDDDISYAEYWSVRLDIDNWDVTGEWASESIDPCEPNTLVSPIDSREDILVKVQTCELLIVSAYTRTDEFLTEIEGGIVHFAAYNTKGCTIYTNTARTEGGVARIELCEGYGWVHVSGATEPIENTTHWIATMTHNGETLSGTTMGGINCQGAQANAIEVQNDYTDIIIFDEEPNFDGLLVTVICEDKTPIPGVQVWLDLYFEGMGAIVYRTYGITNTSGEFYVTNDDSNWYVYNGLWHTNGHPFQADGWIGHCQVGDEIVQFPQTGYQDISNTAMTLMFECKPEYPFDTVKVYTYAGAPGNCSIITGADAHIILYNDSGNTQEFNGPTNASGYYSVDFDDCNLEGTLVSWNCYAIYNEERVNGVNLAIQGNNNYQNLYFINENPQTEFDLIVTAYTNTNNIDSPYQGGFVTFYVISNKGVVCTKSDYTNGYGVASVNLSDPDWDISNDYGPAALADACCWYAVMPYNNVIYSGISSTHLTSHCFTFDMTSNPIDTVREDIIRINLGGGDWMPLCDETEHEFWVCVRGFEDTPDSQCDYDENGGEGLYNVPVSVSGYTGDGGNVFWIGGRTDSDGRFRIGDAPLLWTKIAGNGNQTVYDINYFSACCYYNSEFITCGVSAKYCKVVLKVKKKLEPMSGDPSTICEHLDDCNYKWFDIYLDGDGNKKLVYQGGIPPYPDNLVIIRPKKQFRTGFWENLDDFERVLFDRQTIPVYKAKFETPYLLDNRYYYNLKQYVWPTVDGETPDLTTLRFQGFINSLIDLAEYHDEFNSDNLWRMMTHESIKNLDWTFMRTKDDEDTESGLDSSRMRGVLSVWGRHFDDIKRYADNIKVSNTITYDEKNNLPDYFLTDKVEVGGFEAKSVTAFSALTSDTNRTDTPQQTTSAFGKTMGQVNSDFMRRLAINEVYIQSMKGTRRGIEAILGLFGYVENSDTANPFTNIAGEYDIHEYISVATEFPSYEEASRLRALGEYVNYDDNTNFMDGYPVAVVSPRGDDSEEADYYLIPWFNSKEKYKYPFYFQQKGGWGRMLTKVISEPITIATSITESYSMSIYKETEPYMKFVRDIEELKQIPNDIVFENMVCYVTDISAIYDEYNEEPINPDPLPGEGRAEQTEPPTVNTQEEPEKDYSHYFVLKNVSLSNYVGFVSSERYYCYGWKNVRMSEYEGTEPTTDDGFRVLYLESIFQNNKDNNPHAGYGSYDDGSSYLERFDRIFGEDLDNRVFDFLLDGDEEDMNDYNEILEIGFGLSGLVENNKKCYFFDDTDSRIEMRLSAGHQNQEQPQIGPNNWMDDLYSLVPVGEEDEYDYDDYEAFVNPEEGGEKTDEAAANSIINVKNLVINFGTGGNVYLKKYIETVVMPYLEHMIPSTTILRYRFDNTVSDIEIENMAQGTIFVDRILADGIVTDENSIYLIENNDGII